MSEAQEPKPWEQESGEDSTPDGEEFELSEGTPLYELVQRRKKKNQDLVVIVSDYHNRRGTGKSILSCKLADAFDETAEGLTTEKATLDAHEMVEAYVGQPKQSGLVLDEAEAGLSKYESGSSVNKAVREVVSMGRIEEKYLVLNLPASAELDRDLKALCDVWVLVLRRGLALVHFLKYNPYGEHPMAEKKQLIEWSDIPGSHRVREVYNHLTDRKRAHLRGDDSDGGFVRKKEMEEAVEKSEKEAERETRDALIKKMARETDLTNADIGDIVGLSAGRVSQLK
ncbi:hypothetical protein SAMN06269185_3344 [Natronoarchaeum philippinense]|uniref:Uncharacterized protein n=1 Tax=Natronoarchaeum philippinense TaxID=558529 RepID=A0A285PAA1_NATPI|nr:hypothetical protein [Natronoarchaeum philippinense]SNZ18358.1 hypothetical protein SAMN06269185_3344 [Natronoarchaeum philippinense]